MREFEFPAPRIDTEIYGMPMFVTLEATDLERSRAFYTQALDFVELAAIPGPDGADVLVHLRRWRYQDVLLARARGPVQPGHGLSVGLGAEEPALAALAERARAAGAGVEGPVDTPWNTTDVRVVDPDGYRLTYTAPRPASRRDAAFDAMMTDLPTA